ncbi:MAG: signal peptide peptidase SppA [Deltaproteobacteria bacterium]|nr:MAG: signal peptide peptidase SppA [Deltaproteobacteria bacterium]
MAPLPRRRPAVGRQRVRPRPVAAAGQPPRRRRDRARPRDLGDRGCAGAAALRGRARGAAARHRGVRGRCRRARRRDPGRRRRLVSRGGAGRARHHRAGRARDPRAPRARRQLDRDQRSRRPRPARHARRRAVVRRVRRDLARHRAARRRRQNPRARRHRHPAAVHAGRAVAGRHARPHRARRAVRRDRRAPAHRAGRPAARDRARPHRAGRGRDVRRRGRRLGRPVSGTGRDYYVATAAHKIYVDPAGGLRLVGMAGTTMYFRGAFDEFGVLPQFEKIAEYKSAPEQFTETAPTAAAAQMRNELFDSLWDGWLNAVADARHLTREQVLALVDGGPYTAGDLARDTRLVDAVAGPDKVSQLVIGEIGEVLPVTSPAAVRPERWQPPAIAVLYIEGDITDGKSQSVPLLGQNLAGGETLITALTEARSDPRIGAIVLRIDSPGGSALASELIAREVFATRGVKPILCSMSNVAASGGYFVAAGCDLIFAEPMTITGSIGIFSGKFDIAGLARKLGVTTDTYKRGKHADLESMFRPYTDEERAMLKDNLRYMYGRFVGAVAEGRSIKQDAVDAVGRGHVWSGVQAMPIKLIDRFGGLGDAIDEAKRRLGLAASARIQLRELPEQPTSLLTALGSLLGISEERTLQPADLPGIKQLLQGVPASLLVSPGQPQARLPFDITWQ